MRNKSWCLQLNINKNNYLLALYRDVIGRLNDCKQTIFGVNIIDALNLQFNINKNNYLQALYKTAIKMRNFLAKISGFFIIFLFRGDKRINLKQNGIGWLNNQNFRYMLVQSWIYYLPTYTYLYIVSILYRIYDNGIRANHWLNLSKKPKFLGANFWHFFFCNNSCPWTCPSN